MNEVTQKSDTISLNTEITTKDYNVGWLSLLSSLVIIYGTIKNYIIYIYTSYNDKTFFLDSMMKA